MLLVLRVKQHKNLFHKSDNHFLGQAEHLYI